MASLSQADRLAWLSSLAESIATHAREGGPVDYPAELAEVARACRLGLVDTINRQLGPFDGRILDALLEVPREHFVRLEHVGLSADDAPLALDDAGLATISAPHAYALSFRLLGLSEGDDVIELGTGTGYGAALAAFIVGRAGHVVTFEIDPALARAARRTLAPLPNVTVVEADATRTTVRWGHAKKFVATFAVEAIPPAWLDALPEGGSLVVPVGPDDDDQQLVLAVRREGAVVQSKHGAVRYVKNRSRF